MQKNKGYPPEFVDQVRNASNIVEIAKTYLPLKQKGQDFWACCPFHNEKTPSFAISNTKQFYYCYGCHEAGNVFSLVMRMENLSFAEAVEFLAKRANLELPQTTDNSEFIEKRKKKEKIYQALILARDYYCQTLYLPKNQAALQYLHNRGIDDELIKLFHIGYSDSWQGVVDELKRQGIDETTMKAAGIVSAGEKGRIYDAQFERITFSIHDVYGNCIGFTGRTMKTDKEMAKYKNTAETMVFNKSNIVYGVDVMKAKTRGTHIDGLIVVEGNVDEIAMIKHGFVNTVACMGTALTKFHAGIMARFGKVVYLCLDGDEAGQHAALRSIDVLQEAGLVVKVVTLPNNQDPDEFLTEHGAKAMQTMLADSVGGLEFKLNYIKSHCDLTNRIGKTDYLNQVVELLLQIQSSAERELYLPDVAAAVGVEVEAIRNTINHRIGKENHQKDKNTTSGINQHHNNHKITDSKLIKAEQTIVRAILHERPYAQLDPGGIPELSNPLYQKIVQQGLKLKEIDDKLDENELNAIKPLLFDDSELTNQEQMKEWDDCMKVLKIHALTQKRNATKDISEIAELTKQIKQLNQKQKVEE